MKIIIVHGDNTYRSYQRLTQFIQIAKKRDWEIINDEANPAPSLFGKKRLVVIRNLSLLTPKSLKGFFPLEETLVIYSDETLPASFFKPFPKETKVEKYALRKTIFNFLETLSLKTLHEIVQKEPIEFIFALLGKHLRDLYWIKAAPKTLNYPGWRKSKLNKQAASFTTSQLKEMIEDLAKIDIEVKTSQADLLSSLDLLLASRLK